MYVICNKSQGWNKKMNQSKIILTFRSPEMFAPARMPVADGKKMENMPKKLPPGPRQSGTKLVAKMSAVRRDENRLVCCRQLDN